jgi:hypothetical protein
MILLAVSVDIFADFAEAISVDAFVDCAAFSTDLLGNFAEVVSVDAFAESDETGSRSARFIRVRKPPSESDTSLEAAVVCDAEWSVTFTALH